MLKLRVLAFISIAAPASIVNIDDGFTAADAGGSWNFGIAGTYDGTHSFAATEADTAGNTSVASRPVNRAVLPSITSFTSTPNSVFDIGGDAYRMETAGQSYSLTSPDPQTLRFEIRPGDKAWYDYTNGAAVDRANIDGSAGGDIPAGTPVNISYQFMVEANGPNGSFTNTASWFTTGEMHNDDKVSGVHTSPPFAIQLAGNHLQVVARYCPTGLDPSNGAGNLKMLTLWTDPNPITTGQYYNISIQSNVSNTGAGYLHVSINGNQVVNYNGPLGYGDPTYWVEGLYRNAGPTETVAADYRNLVITSGSTSR